MAKGRPSKKIEEMQDDHIEDDALDQLAEEYYEFDEEEDESEELNFLEDEC